MKATFDNVTIKCWFTAKGVSRNFYNVKMIYESENSYLIKTAEGGQYIMPMVNVNMIEEISTN